MFALYICYVVFLFRYQVHGDRIKLIYVMLCSSAGIKFAMALGNTTVLRKHFKAEFHDMVRLLILLIIGI